MRIEVSNLKHVLFFEFQINVRTMLELKTILNRPLFKNANYMKFTIILIVHLSVNTP